MTWTIDDTFRVQISDDRELTIAFLTWQKENSIYPSIFDTSYSSFDGCGGVFYNSKRSMVDSFFEDYDRR